MSAQGVTITVNAESGAAAENLQRFFNGAVAGFDKLSGATRFLEELAGKIIAGLSVAAIVEFTREAINAAEAMGRLSRQVGFSLDSLSALKTLANENGIQFEELRLGLTHFNEVLNNAAQQGGEAMQSFRNLSEEIAVAVALGRPAEQVYAMIAERFKQMPDGIQKTAAAQMMFGRASAQWVTLLNEGAEGLEKIKSLGGVFTPEAVANATEFNRTLREWREQAEVFVQTIVNGVMPALLRLQTIPTLIAAAFKDNQLPELIGLMIEAGMEIGAIAVKKTWTTVWQSLTGATAGQIYMTLLNAIMSFGVGAAKFLINVLTEPIVFMSAGFDWLGSHLKEIFTDSINYFIKQWDIVIAKLHGSDKMKLSLIDSSDASTFEESLRDMRNFIEPLSKSVTDSLTNSLQQSRDILGINSKLSNSDDTRADAVKRLLNLMDEQLKKAESIHKILTVPPPGAGTGNTNPGNQDKIAAAGLELQREAIQLQEKQIETDPYLVQGERLRQLLPLMIEEHELLAQQIEQQQSIADRKSSVPLERIAAEKEIIKLQAQDLDLMRKMQQQQGQNSFFTQMQLGLTKLQSDWGQVSQNISADLMGGIKSAIDGVSEAIMGMIQGTKTWGQVFAQVGDAIIATIVRTVVQWIASMTIIAALKEIFGEEDNQAAQDSATAWAPAAVAASIASYGSAAAIGAAAFIAAEALGTAVAGGLSSRAVGGPVTSGVPYLVGERGPELIVPQSAGHVMTASQTANLMNFRSLAGTGGSHGTVNAAPKIAVNLFYDKNEITKHAKENPDFHHVLVDIIKRNSHFIRNQ